MKFELGRLLFLVCFLAGAFAHADQCRNLFEVMGFEQKLKSRIDQEAQLLEMYLFDALAVKLRASTDSSPSVKVVEVNDSELKLERQLGRQWYSAAPLVEGQPLSNQGDVFNPVILFGSKLAAHLGFRIEMAKTGEPILVVPNAKTLKKKIRLLNAKLRFISKEEIGFQPISVGYVNGLQMLKLSIGGPDGFEMQFPFSDKDFRAAPHEVSFHLVGLLLPKSILKRTQAVSLRTLQLAEILQDPKSELGEWGKWVAQQLIDDRSLDLDLGTGNLTADLVHYRRASKMQDYGARQGVEYADERNMISDLILLARPTQLPSVVAVERLVRMVGLNVHSQNLKGGPLDGKFFHPLESLTRSNVLSQNEKKLPVKYLDIAKVESLIKDFIRSHRDEDSAQFAAFEDPSILSTDFMKSLDARIALFIKLFEEGAM